LKNKSKRFEESHNSRTYFIFDENHLEYGILAYFSLSFKEISLDPNISKSEKKLLDGISKIPDKVRVFLLGQIAKNDIRNNPIKLPEIFEEIYNILFAVQKKIGGRALLLECEDNSKLISLYEKEGFKILQKQDLVQMYKMINFIK